MTYILNIGLARQGNSNLGVGTVLREIENCGFDLGSHAVHHSDTEITVVALVAKGPGFFNPRISANRLAIVLQQDCVAVFNPSAGFGYLAGPKAAAWGEFNPVPTAVPPWASSHTAGSALRIARSA